MFHEIVRRQKSGESVGCFSVCSGNFLVIEAALRRAKAYDQSLVIEATANQVSPEGGYTGLTPERFRGLVESKARDVHFPLSKLYFGGDHLGPLTYKHLPAEEAMKKAKDLVASYVAAGYTKIHLDASMPLGGEKGLSVKTIANRTAELAKACEVQLEKNHLKSELVYVVGSEVPTPGGETHLADALSPTTPNCFRETVEAMQLAFVEHGIEACFEKVVGIVVQPGVEFSQFGVYSYNQALAKPLTDALKAYPQFVFEGHSTDYQTTDKLKQMVEDGIAFLKVGPALTFSLREAIFSLTHIERSLGGDGPSWESDLDTLMLEDETHWKQHYFGEKHDVALARKYSYSDRARYYLSHPKMEKATEALFQRLDSQWGRCPLPLIRQFMPREYEQLRAHKIELSSRELVIAHIGCVIDQYYEAVGGFL